MTLDEFIASTADPSSQTPSDLRGTLVSLWHVKRGEWERAHEVVQALEGAEAAWVHAHLHRVEGDLPNARYWYGRANRDEPEYNTSQEWQVLAKELLESDE